MPSPKKNIEEKQPLIEYQKLPVNPMAAAFSTFAELHEALVLPLFEIFGHHVPNTSLREELIYNTDSSQRTHPLCFGFHRLKTQFTTDEKRAALVDEAFTSFTIDLLGDTPNWEKTKEGQLRGLLDIGKQSECYAQRYFAHAYLGRLLFFFSYLHVLTESDSLGVDMQSFLDRINPVIDHIDLSEAIQHLESRVRQGNVGKSSTTELASQLEPLKPFVRTLLLAHNWVMMEHLAKEIEGLQLPGTRLGNAAVWAKDSGRLLENGLRRMFGRQEKSPVFAGRAIGYKVGELKRAFEESLRGAQLTERQQAALSQYVACCREAFSMKNIRWETFESVNAIQALCGDKLPSLLAQMAAEDAVTQSAKDAPKVDGASASGETRPESSVVKVDPATFQALAGGSSRMLDPVPIAHIVDEAEGMKPSALLDKMIAGNEQKRKTLERAKAILDAATAIQQELEGVKTKITRFVAEPKVGETAILEQLAAYLQDISALSTQLDDYKDTLCASVREAHAKYVAGDSYELSLKDCKVDKQLLRRIHLETNLLRALLDRIRALLVRVGELLHLRKEDPLASRNKERLSPFRKALKEVGRMVGFKGTRRKGRFIEPVTPKRMRVR